MSHPKYVQRAYESLRKFSRTPHKGLTLALGDERAIREVAYDLAQHPANPNHIIKPEVRELFDAYRGTPVLYTDDIYKVFSVMTNEQGHIDCLLSIDPRGHLIEIDGFLKLSDPLISQARNFDLDWGTRHWACETASCYRGVYTMALSKRRNTLTAYHKGRIVPSLSHGI